MMIELLLTISLTQPLYVHRGSRCLQWALLLLVVVAVVAVVVVVVVVASAAV